MINNILFATPIQYLIYLSTCFSDENIIAFKEVYEFKSWFLLSLFNGFGVCSALCILFFHIHLICLCLWSLIFLLHLTFFLVFMELSMICFLYIDRAV